MNDANDLSALFECCGIAASQRSGGTLAVRSAVDGTELARLHETPQTSSATARRRASRRS